MEDEGISGYISDFEKCWPRILYHIGETYRRPGLHRRSLHYFNQAILLNTNDYMPYIGSALTYNAMGDRDLAMKMINTAEKITSDPEASYYKELLGF